MAGVGRLCMLAAVVALVVDVLINYELLPPLLVTSAAELNDDAVTTTPTSPSRSCECQQSTVEANTATVLTVLNRITRSPFFRYYKANTHKECPYWAVQMLCTASPSADGSMDSPCSLCTCSEDAIPQSIKSQDANDDRSGTGLRDDVGGAVTMGTTPVTIEEWGEGFAGAGRKDSKAHHAFLSEADLEVEYIDLVLNPEANTGYSGPMANRVWEAIYAENCLKDATETLHVAPDEAAQCSELTIFFRLMSGFHSSIAFNVAANFHKLGYVDEQGHPVIKKTTKDEEKGTANPFLASTTSSSPRGEGQHEATATPAVPVAIPLYGPNCGFLGRLRSFPDRIENLNFLYQFVLRAVSKAAPLLLDDVATGKCASGDLASDAALASDIQHLAQPSLLCSKTFDDATFLKSKYAQHLLPQMRQKMKNISTLMDCVACEKCRLWGKLEAEGIATAIKVIGFPTSSLATTAHHEEDHECSGGGGGGDTERGKKHLSGLKLRRSEKVALINLLRQLSFAVVSLQTKCLSSSGDAPPAGAPATQSGGGAH